MKYSLLLLLTFCSWSDGAPIEDSAPKIEASSYTDRNCGSTYNNLWLDIVFLVDNSIGMGHSQLSTIGATIQTIMTGTNIGTDPTNPRTTRVGIATYNENATVIAGLDTFKSTDDFINNWGSYEPTPSKSPYATLAKGLTAASNIFDAGWTDARDVVRKVVVIIASAYDENGAANPVPISQQLKTDGVTIVTVAYSQQSENKLLEELGKVASPGFSFNNFQGGFNMTGTIQNAFIQTNCFCPNGWTQYRQSYGDAASSKFGVCLKPVVLPSNWIGAKSSCNHQWNNGYLVNEYSQQKHDYVLNLVHDTPAFQHPYKYHIGLSYYNSYWYWEQPVGLGAIPLSTASFAFSGWTPGFPVIDSTKMVAMNSETATNSTGWQNIVRTTENQFYVCEVAACDTDNYCSSVDN